MADILHYRGDITAALDREQMLGPDLGRRHLAIRDASYDPATDLTTVKLRGILPDEFRKRVESLVEVQRERERIRGLFDVH